MGLSKWRTTSMTWCTRSQWTTWFKACGVIAKGREARYDTWLPGLRGFSAMQMKETRLFLWGFEGSWFQFVGHDQRIGKCYFVGRINYKKVRPRRILVTDQTFLLSSHLIVFTCPGAPQGAYARPGYTPAMQLVTPRAVAMAVRIEMAVWMTKRHNCLFFSSMIFLSFKGLTNEVFSLSFRWQREDMLRRQPIQLLQYFTTKFALSTQCPQCH